MNRARLVYATALSAMIGWGLIAPQPAQAQLGLGSLIVTITFPADGSPVSGTVPVNATVSIIGSLTVSQVQFYRDGNLIGSDSAAPYSVSWNTTSTNNGSHTLTAVATDVLGVRWNSNPVTVTVSNGPPPDTTPPSVPTGLTASAVSSSQINLSWTASSDNVGVSGRRGYLNGTQSAPTGARSFANTGLSPSTTYSYTVAAYDAAGNLSAQSSSASATTPAPPDTTPPTVPTGLTASAVSSSQINLSWTASSDNVGVSGRRGYRNGTQIATTGATSFANTGLSPSTTYSYTVAAYDAAGNLSAQSSSASATTPAPPDTTPPSVPTGLTASAVSSSQINLSWTASSDNVGVSGYRVYRNGTQIATTGATSFANTGLSPSTTYSYTVAAYDAAGNLSTQSSSASATTPAPPDTTPPAVTINQAAGQADPTSSSPINFTAVFSEPVSGFSGAGVTISGTAGGTKTATVSGGPSTYSVAVSGMTTAGTVLASIAAGVASDAAGNGNTASTSTDNSVSFTPSDTTPPTVTINQAAGQADPTSSSPINFTAVFSKPISGFTSAGITLSGTAGGIKTATVSGGPTIYTVEVSGMTSSGTVLASIPAGVASDAAGNLNTASTSTDNSVTFTPVSPIVLENQQPGSGNWRMWLHNIPPADDVNKQIKGYASATSVNKGESITFYVTVNPAQQYTMDVYCMGWYQGLGGRLMQSIGPLQGVAQPDCPGDATTGLTECNWTATYTLTVPPNWAG